MKPLPTWATPTEEDLEAQNELVRAVNLRGHLNPAEMMVARGRAKEMAVRANLASMEKVRPPDYEEQQAFQLSQLGEALFEQGRMAEALAVHPSKERKAEIRGVVEAIDRPDDAVCQCGATPLSVQEVYSLKHKRVVTVTKCPVCGRTNTS